MLILSLLISFGLYRISVTLLFNSKLSDYLLIFLYICKKCCVHDIFYLPMLLYFGRRWTLVTSCCNFICPFTFSVRAYAYGGQTCW